jgi:hypothetical protein
MHGIYNKLMIIICQQLLIKVYKYLNQINNLLIMVQEEDKKDKKEI